MNLDMVGRVFAKEVRETLRDRRTVIIMLVLPVFVYPALLIAVQQLVMIGQRSIQEQAPTVAVHGADPGLIDFLAEHPGLDVEVVEEPQPGRIESGEIDALLDFSPRAVDTAPADAALIYDASRERSRLAHERVALRLGTWGDTLLARQLAAAGLPRSLATPMVVADSSIATPERMGGYALGRFLPAVLILMTLLGAFFPAIDLTAGEKERGTLETLLTTPVPAREIIAGKFLTVCVAAIATATLNVISMLLTFEWGVFQLSRVTDLQLRIPLSTAGLVGLLMVPLAVFFAALFLGIAVRAHSFKEAQNSLTPIQFAALIPIYLPMIPGIPLDYLTAAVPVGGVALLFRDLMAGQAEPGPGIFAVFAMITYAALALRFAARAFGREDVLFGTGSGEEQALGWRVRLARWRAGPRAVPRASEALAFVAVVGLLYLYLGVRLQAIGLERGLFASQWLLLGFPALLLVAWGPYRARETLALRAPRGRHLGAALLLIAGGIPISWFLGWLQGLTLDVPEEYLETFRQLLTAETPARFAWLVLLIAVTPAICEELVFRGVLLQGLGDRLREREAVIASAIIFGGFHLSFETVIRFLPTAWLGLLLGLVVWRTGSLYPAILMHFLNNGLALALVSWTGAEAYVFGPSGEPRWIAVGTAVILLAGGYTLLPDRAPRAAPA